MCCSIDASLHEMLSWSNGVALKWCICWLTFWLKNQIKSALFKTNFHLPFSHFLLFTLSAYLYTPSSYLTLSLPWSLLKSLAFPLSLTLHVSLSLFHSLRLSIHPLLLSHFLNFLISPQISLSTYLFISLSLSTSPFLFSTLSAYLYNPFSSLSLSLQSLFFHYIYLSLLSHFILSPFSA